MKNTLRDNCYLENIIKDIRFNMRLASSRSDVDIIGMLKYVIKYCEREIIKLEGHNGSSREEVVE